MEFFLDRRLACLPLPLARLRDDVPQSPDVSCGCLLWWTKSRRFRSFFDAVFVAPAMAPLTADGVPHPLKHRRTRFRPTIASSPLLRKFTNSPQRRVSDRIVYAAKLFFAPKRSGFCPIFLNSMMRPVAVIHPTRPSIELRVWRSFIRCRASAVVFSFSSLQEPHFSGLPTFMSGTPPQGPTPHRRRSIEASSTPRCAARPPSWRPRRVAPGCHLFCYRQACRFPSITKIGLSLFLFSAPARDSESLTRRWRLICRFLPYVSTHVR